MNLIASGLGVTVAASGASGVAAAVLPARWRAGAVGIGTSVAGVAGVVAGAAALSGRVWRSVLPNLLPLAGVRLEVDALSGWFLLVVGGVAALVGVYTAGYAGRTGTGASSRTALAALPLFVAAMLVVPVAGSVSTLLLAWESMALFSLLLVMTEHAHGSEVRSAGRWYSAMTQAGFVAILFALVWAAAACGGESFTTIRQAAPGLPSVARGGVFVLAAAGFAAKAGMVPLHPWLPRAHAEAPSHVSALMSAAMVSLGVYGIVRLGFDLLGGGPAWWWILLAAGGALSALYGILQAALAVDVKKMLAYSTAENTGLILLGVGAAGLFADAGQAGLAGVALAAALLHVLNHAGFKTLLFFAAGAVVRATGTRDLDRLGGLGRRMPATTAAFALAALCAAALPPGNGFVSEWLLLQSLIHALPPASDLNAIAAPVAVGVVALTAGLGVAAYVKTLGTGFLARPRSSAAEAAREAGPMMLAAMAAAGLGCGLLAIAPGLTASALTRATMITRGGSPLTGTTRLHLPGVGALYSPLLIVVVLAVLVAGISVAARTLGRPRRRAVAWGCGDGPQTARTQYTATSFAEPLQRVFDDVLRPEQDVEVSHYDESAYLVERVRFQLRVPDRIETYLYVPLLAAGRRVGRAARVLANGSVHRYLAYGLVALLIVLVAGVSR
ncbi:proton-conducting transporter transmembrane domain-containing protein [Actinoallomurus sp. CA-150999]|uniref:proton-conducting transporter transmembrane domain-containing protein n=1 Tax=Actinoallomurus sp. CA-150999 TaxID=3239887 RepID=UPI003D89E270